MLFQSKLHAFSPVAVIAVIGAHMLQVRTPDGETRKVIFSILVVAAGPHSGEVAKLLRIGTGTGLLERPLPVEPRLVLLASSYHKISNKRPICVRPPRISTANFKFPHRSGKAPQCPHHKIYHTQATVAGHGQSKFQ